MSLSVSGLGELWYLREKKQFSSVPGFPQLRLFLPSRDIHNECNVIKPQSASDQALSATWAAQGRCAVWELTN